MRDQSQSVGVQPSGCTIVAESPAQLFGQATRADGRTLGCSPSTIGKTSIIDEQPSGCLPHFARVKIHARPANIQNTTPRATFWAIKTRLPSSPSPPASGLEPAASVGRQQNPDFVDSPTRSGTCCPRVPLALRCVDGRVFSGSLQDRLRGPEVEESSRLQALQP